MSSRGSTASIPVAKATMADRAAAERPTGYVIGGDGVGPRAVQRRKAWLGRRGASQDLIGLTNAVTADIRAS